MGTGGGRGGRAGAGLPRAVSYLRVSTGAQVDSTSIDTQREQCRALARAHGLVLVGEYLDAGVSGAAASRPALEELLAAATAGEVEVVLVAKLDRLGRSLLHLLGLIEHLNALGLRVISASDMIDTKTPAGRMMLGLLGAFAEFERERLTRTLGRGRLPAGVGRRVRRLQSSVRVPAGARPHRRGRCRAGHRPHPGRVHPGRCTGCSCATGSR